MFIDPIREGLGRMWELSHQENMEWMLSAGCWPGTAGPGAQAPAGPGLAQLQVRFLSGEAGSLLGSTDWDTTQPGAAANVHQHFGEHVNKPQRFRKENCFFSEGAGEKPSQNVGRLSALHVGDVIRTLRRLSWFYSLILFRAPCSSEAERRRAGREPVLIHSRLLIIPQTSQEPGWPRDSVQVLSGAAVAVGSCVLRPGL